MSRLREVSTWTDRFTYWSCAVVAFSALKISVFPVTGWLVDKNTGPLINALVIRNAKVDNVNKQDTSPASKTDCQFNVALELAVVSYTPYLDEGIHDHQIWEMTLCLCFWPFLTRKQSWSAWKHSWSCLSLCNIKSSSISKSFSYQFTNHFEKF